MQKICVTVCNTNDIVPCLLAQRSFDHDAILLVPFFSVGITSPGETDLDLQLTLSTFPEDLQTLVHSLTTENSQSTAVSASSGGQSQGPHFSYEGKRSVFSADVVRAPYTSPPTEPVRVSRLVETYYDEMDQYGASASSSSLLPYSSTLHHSHCGCPPNWKRGTRAADVVDLLLHKAVLAYQQQKLLPTRHLRIAYMLPHHNITGEEMLLARQTQHKQPTCCPALQLSHT